MFRAAMCPSSGELILSMRHLVYVTLYTVDDRLVCRSEFRPAYQKFVYTEWHIPGVALIQLILLMIVHDLNHICVFVKEWTHCAGCSRFNVKRVCITGFH